MKCSQCREEFLEKDLDLSHDVPCYLFEGNRKARKNKADKFGFRCLCKKCHKIYEEDLRLQLIIAAGLFSKQYFKEEEDGNNS